MEKKFKLPIIQIEKATSYYKWKGNLFNHYSITIFIKKIKVLAFSYGVKANL